MLERPPTSMSAHYQYVRHIFVHTQLESVEVKTIVKTKKKRPNIFRSVPSLRVQSVRDIGALCISQRFNPQLRWGERNRDNEECQTTSLSSPAAICMKSVSFFLLKVLRKWTTPTLSADNVLFFPKSLFGRSGIDLSRHLVRIGRPSSEPTPARLVGRHLSSLIPQNENKQLPTWRCFVCSQTEKKTNRTRHESRYECTICKVGLCVDPCFRISHTLLNFWT